MGANATWGVGPKIAKMGARRAALVPAFGARVKFRRYRLGRRLIDGAAAARMVTRRTPEFDSAEAAAALPMGALNCPGPACGGVEAANHALLHCPRTLGPGPGVPVCMWDEAISAATEGGEWGSGGIGVERPGQGE